MADELSNDPPPWPARRALIAAAVLALLVVVGWLLTSGGTAHRTAPRPSPVPPRPSLTVPTITSVPTLPPTQPPSPPPTLIGPAPSGTGVRLLVVPESYPARAPVGVLTLDSGSTATVRGFPAGGCLAASFQLPAADDWVVVWQPPGAGAQACGDVGGGRIYVVDAASATARLIGDGDFAVPADRDSVWTVASLETSQQTPSRRRVQRVTLTGAPVGPAYRLPLGWTLSKGLTPDRLLLTREYPPPGPGNWEVWQPSNGRVLVRPDRVLAAGPSLVAWVDDSCVAGHCPVRLSSPIDGATTTVAMPQATYPYDGSLSDDGKYLALDLSTGADAQGATDEDTGAVVDVSTRRVRLIEQTKVAAGEAIGDLSLAWASRGWLMVSAPGAGDTRQLAAYNPASGTFLVSRRLPPAGLAVSF